MFKALYGMLESSLKFYEQLRKDLKNAGFKVNPYDPCVANKIANGTQMTVTWHVDDLKVSHMEGGELKSLSLSYVAIMERRWWHTT